MAEATVKGRLDIRQLSTELKDVADRWFEFGVQLGVPVRKLKEIEGNHGKDWSRCLIELLQFWMNSSNETFRDDIHTALRKVDMTSLADRLETEHSTPDVDLINTLHHGPVQMLIKPGVSKDQLISLLAGYANMLLVLRTSNLPDEKFQRLKFFVSDFCDDVSIQECSSISNMINILKTKLKIYPFNIDALIASSDHFCSSAVTDSLQKYKQQLNEFLLNTSVKDLKDSLKTKLLDNSGVESFTLKLDEKWMENTLLALKRLVYHLVGVCSKSLILSHTCLGCVCVTWIVPIKMVPNLRATVKDKQLSSEYMINIGVLEFVIGLRIAPNEALFSGLSGTLESAASDPHTEIGDNEMIQQILRVRERINSDIEQTTKVLKMQNEELESEFTAMQRDYEKKCKELELKCSQLEEKCKELESDVEMFEQKAKTSATSTVDSMITFEDETFNVMELPKSNSVLVKKYEDFITTFSTQAVSHFIMLSKLIWIAYNKVVENADLQKKILRIAVFVSKLNVDCFEPQYLRTALLNLQPTYLYLLSGMDNMASVVLQSIESLRRRIAEAAKQLAIAFDEVSEHVEYILADAIKMIDSSHARKVANSLRDSVRCLKLLSDSMRHASSVWRSMERELEQLESYNNMIMQMITVSTKYHGEKRALIFKSKGFKTKLIVYFARWIALSNVCELYYDAIKVAQREACEILEESHAAKETRQNFQQMAVMLLSKLEKQRDIAVTEDQRIAFDDYIKQMQRLLLDMFVDLDSIEIPSNWEPQYENLKLVTVSSSTSEWQTVSSRFQSTMASATIRSIQRIQNKWLWKKYAQHKKMIEEKNGGASNEMELFHGTRAHMPREIYESEEGFDMRFSAQGMWGQANYFAVNASYSNNYAHRNSSTGHREMFLAKVLTGNSYACGPNSSLRMPPKSYTAGSQLGQDRYDTVTGTTGGSQVYMTYDNQKAYPAYLITY